MLLTCSSHPLCITNKITATPFRFATSSLTFTLPLKQHKLHSTTTASSAATFTAFVTLSTTAAAHEGSAAIASLPSAHVATTASTLRHLSAVFDDEQSRNNFETNSTTPQLTSSTFAERVTERTPRNNKTASRNSSPPSFKKPATKDNSPCVSAIDFED
ncbi:hypothetical protein V8G54_012657 [Vigna mungo]|uniref:Uncharacterized protein n=1 Tax=Vigna mungo TaxID=3915 RepID=A0AAQ3S413_VIGMU